jgi:periplasmic protein TonB
MPVEMTLTSMSEKNLESIAKSAVTLSNKPTTTSPSFQSPSFDASYLDNPAPDYPSISRRLGEQGRVLLRVLVAVDGTANSVVVQTSSGSSRLDQATLAAVKKWRFVPARHGGQAVVASVIVPVSFSIEG